MADVKWIKITTDMFDNRKIKHLRKLPEGDSIVLIWVMLLTMAGRCNAGGMIFLTENIPYTPKMLADELDFEESTVILALKSLENFSMIVTDNGFFSIAGWEEYQNTDRLAEIREYNRIAKQKERAKKKALPDVKENVNDMSMTSQRCQDTDIDIEEEKEEDKKKKSKTKKEKALDLLNSLLPDCTFSEDVKTKMTEWISYKAEINDFYTETGLITLLSKVTRKCKEHGEQAVIEVIDDSMSSLYKGIIFDRLKTKKQPTPIVKEKPQNSTDAFFGELQRLYNEE